MGAEGKYDLKLAGTYDPESGQLQVSSTGTAVSPVRNIDPFNTTVQSPDVAGPNHKAAKVRVHA